MGELLPSPTYSFRPPRQYHGGKPTHFLNSLAPLDRSATTTGFLLASLGPPSPSAPVQCPFAVAASERGAPPAAEAFHLNEDGDDGKAETGVSSDT